MWSTSILSGALLQLILLATGLRSVSATPALSARASGTCTLTASVGDDAPAFLKAAADPSCATVAIPAGTTLSIHTKMNMTGLSNKHIVSPCVPLQLFSDLKRVARQNLQGTVKFNPDLDYWTDNAFPFSFQDQTAFWLLGGTNLQLDGGGTLDGSGQAWYDKLYVSPMLSLLRRAQFS